MAGWHSGVRDALADGLGLVLPVECAGCGAWDVAVCADCAALLAVEPRRCEEDAPLLVGTGLAVWCLAPYAGEVRELVLGWKSRGRADVAPVVRAAGERAGAAWARELALDGGGDVVVVPAPSGLRRRLRGELVVGGLADAVGRGLAAALPAGRRVLVVDALRRRGGRAHQSGLGARRRATNRRGSVRLVVDLPAGADVLLVDDVVTTGATLADCARALAAHRVRGALVVAASPPTRRRAGLAPLAQRAPSRPSDASSVPAGSARRTRLP